MRNHNSKIKISVFLLSTFCFLFSIFSANAQTAPQFLISWKADSYAPNWYQGKVFPTRGSRVEVAFELIDNGKVADISKTKVRWYVNDRLVLNEKNGLGIKTHSFRVVDYPGQDVEIRIVVVDYKNGDQLSDLIIIPVAHSEAIIDAPYAGRKIGNISNNKHSFSVYPFFFNVSDLSKLSFKWLVNNRPAESGGSAEKLDLSVDPLAPSGFEIDISAKINNLSNEIEFASKNIKVIIK